MKYIGKNHVSVIGNFICTKENRLKVLRQQVPVMAEIFEDYDFYINYNTDINLDEVRKLFEDNIKNLHFTNDLRKDWGNTTLDLLKKVKTSHVFYMLEDYVYNYNFESDYIITDLNENIVTEVDIQDRKKFWENMIKESVVNDNVKHMFLAKIKKYLPPSNFVANCGYVEKDYTYNYLAKNSPTGVYSSSAIHDVNIFMTVLENYIKSHSLPSPGEFEQRNEIMRSFGELLCAIPKEQIVIQTHLEGEIDR